MGLLDSFYYTYNYQANAVLEINSKCSCPLHILDILYGKVDTHFNIMVEIINF